MIWFPRYNLFSIREKISGDKNFKKNLRQVLIRRYEQFFPASIFVVHHYWRYATVAVCLILFLSIGTGAYAYNSPDVMEGHPLYSLKRVVEKAELKLAGTAEKKTEVALKHLIRRKQDIKQIKKQKNLKNLDMAINNYQAAVEKAANKAELVTSSEDSGIYIEKVINESLDDMGTELVGLQTKNGDLDDTSDENIEVRQDKITEKMERIREQHEKILERQMKNYEKALEKKSEVE